MQQIIRNTLLEYLPADFEIEKTVNPARIFYLNKENSKTAKKGYIVYLCEREIRAKDNFALQYGIQKSKELSLPLIIIHPKIKYEHKSKEFFINNQLLEIKKSFEKSDLDFNIIEKEPEVFLKNFKISLLIIDFNPILKRNYLKNLECKIIEMDGHNIIPARYLSDKQEYSAATIRRKIYRNIYPFLTEYENFTNTKTKADYVLKDFLNNKLDYYAEQKNNPNKNVLSGLSKYINLGFISSQRIAIEIIKTDTDIKNKEAFLEELITRKELAENFCLYSNYKTFEGIPNWAKYSLSEHKTDLRAYTYLPSDLEFGITHDILWNATQKQLINEGVIHGYLRMYWAKKILEWTQTPEEALDIAIYLNDKYGYDSPSSNGYTGILWAIGGLHDRAFTDYPVTGKIRRMTFDSIRRKFNIYEYINKYA